MTHLGGLIISLDKYEEDVEELNKTFKSMAHSTNLEFIEVVVSLKGLKWIHILRNDDGQYTGWEFVEDSHSLQYGAWGNLIAGFSAVQDRRHHPDLTFMRGDDWCISGLGEKSWDDRTRLAGIRTGLL